MAFWTKIMKIQNDDLAVHCVIFSCMLACFTALFGNINTIHEATSRSYELRALASPLSAQL